MTHDFSHLPFVSLPPLSVSQLRALTISHAQSLSYTSTRTHTLSHTHAHTDYFFVERKRETLISPSCKFFLFLLQLFLKNGLPGIFLNVKKKKRG